MPADDVAQERAQVIGEIARDGYAACALHGGAHDRVSLQRERLERAPN